MTDIVGMLPLDHPAVRRIAELEAEVARLREMEYHRAVYIAEPEIRAAEAAMRERCAVEAITHDCRAKCVSKGCGLPIAAAIRALPLEGK